MRTKLAAALFLIAAPVVILKSGNADGSKTAATASVEYKIISAREFGVTIQPDETGVFNYEEATEKLNELVSKGWRYRDFLPVGANAAFVLEKPR